MGRTVEKIIAFTASFTKSCQSRVVRKVPFIETNLLEIEKALQPGLGAVKIFFKKSVDFLSRD